MLHALPIALAAITLYRHLAQRNYRLAALTVLAGGVLVGCAIYSGV